MFSRDIIAILVVWLPFSVAMWLAAWWLFFDVLEKYARWKNAADDDGKRTD